MANMEAWSTGSVRMELEGGFLPVMLAVEVLRIHELVYVIARADAEDPAFRGGFPMMMTTVEKYPVVSVARDPLAEVGVRARDSFVANVVEHVRKLIEASRAAAPAKQPD